MLDTFISYLPDEELQRKLHPLPKQTCINSMLSWFHRVGKNPNLVRVVRRLTNAL